MSNKDNIVDEGFYYLTKINNTEKPVLVHGYYCSYLEGKFVLGFNSYDGGNFIPIDDLTNDSILIPVEIVCKWEEFGFDGNVEMNKPETRIEREKFNDVSTKET